MGMVPKGQVMFSLAEQGTAEYARVAASVTLAADQQMGEIAHPTGLATALWQPSGVRLVPAP